jgi:hypothetical protein
VARVGVGERERRARRARIGPDLRRCAAEAAAILEPSELEAYGFRLLAAPSLAGAPRELLEDAVEEIAAAPRGGPLLEAIAAAAAPPASFLAAAAAARLREAGGPGSAAAAGVGSLAPVRAWAVADGPDVGVVVACRRPGDPRAQVLGFTVGRQAGVVLLLDGVVTPPLDDPALLAPAEAGARGRSGVEEIAPDRAVARVEQAARGTLAVGRAPTLQAVQALVLLLRSWSSPGAERVLADLHRLALRAVAHTETEPASALAAAATS